MRLLRLGCTYILLILSVVMAMAQQPFAQSQSQDVRISKSRPTVYISFVKMGYAEPLYNGESNERVWLRLHNNTRWRLRFKQSGSPAKEYGVEIPYSVKTIPKNREVIWDPKLVPPPLPPGIDLPKREAAEKSETKKDDDCKSLDFFNGGHLFTLLTLKPGRSLIFTVPREYLCKDLYICVSFEYEWESDLQEQEHKVCFYGHQIPKSNK